jgi:hypothetical protein
VQNLTEANHKKDYIDNELKFIKVAVLELSKYITKNTDIIDFDCAKEHSQNFYLYLNLLIGNEIETAHTQPHLVQDICFNMHTLVCTKVQEYLEFYNFKPETPDPIKIYFWVVYSLYEIGIINNINFLLYSLDENNDLYLHIDKTNNNHELHLLDKTCCRLDKNDLRCIEKDTTVSYDIYKIYKLTYKLLQYKNNYFLNENVT